MVLFKSHRLDFRPLTLSDYPALSALLTDPAVMRWCGGPLPADGVQRWLSAVLAAYARYGYDYWAAETPDGGALIGVFGILRQELDGRPADALAYILVPAYWGQGYATEGAAACLDYAAHTLHLEPIIATVEPGNAASIRVLERCGLRYRRDIGSGPTALRLYTQP